MVFEIIARDKNTKARIGILSTKKGKVETPFFMPVSTKGAPKYLNPIQLKELSNVTISNSFILSLRPGIKVVKKAGGLGKFMNFSGVNFTDSGGFQMYSKSFYEKANDDGVFFKNPISGEKIFMTPEQSMKIQIDIGSDVAMCLDSMPLYENSREEIEESARKTFLWAKKCKKEHDKLQRFTRNSKRQLLFGITQGGVYPDLREKSVREISSLNFDGYSIGGMGMGETKDEEYKIIEIQNLFFLKTNLFILWELVTD
jgi:queuine tRNA-ribosyltransferase